MTNEPLYGALTALRSAYETYLTLAGREDFADKPVMGDYWRNKAETVRLAILALEACLS